MRRSLKREKVTSGRRRRAIRDLKQTRKATATALAKGLMSKTIAVHVRYKFLYISLPSSTKQQREMAKYCVFSITGTAEAFFSHLLLELNAGIYLLSLSKF